MQTGWSEKMGLITLDQLKTGMVLASAVNDLCGRLLAIKGTKLTEDHLKVFKMWGVIEADIKGESSKDSEEHLLERLDPHLLKTVEEHVRRRFVHSDLDQQANQKLFQVCTLRLADSLDHKKPLPTALCCGGSEETESNDESDRPNHSIDPVGFVQEEVSLPVLPGIIYELLETLRNPNSSPKQIAGLIGRDVSLSAKILRLVNSTFYNFPSQIDTLSRAVLVLGTKQLSNLAAGIKLLTFFENIPCTLVDMRSFLNHSITCGTLARTIGTYKNFPNTERLFLGGLLHDIGRLVLYSHSSILAKKALIAANRKQHLLFEAENEIFGFDHAKIGGLLMRKWKLPVSLEVIVEYHHAPLEYRDPLEPAVVHVADVIANAVGRGSSGERFVPPLSIHAWELIGLSARILPTLLEQMEVQRKSFVSDFLGGD